MWYYDAKEYWYSVASPNKIYIIDYLIGEAADLGQGYRKEIVKVLIDKIQKEKSLEAIVVYPEEDNVPSYKTLLMNIFIYVVCC